MNSDGEERVILFLKLTEGSQLSNELVCKVKGAIRFQLTPRHVPAVIMEAPDIPVSFIFEFCSLWVKFWSNWSSYGSNESLIIYLRMAYSKKRQNIASFQPSKPCSKWSLTRSINRSFDLFNLFNQLYYYSLSWFLVDLIFFFAVHREFEKGGGRREEDHIRAPLGRRSHCWPG